MGISQPSYMKAVLLLPLLLFLTSTTFSQETVAHPKPTRFELNAPMIRINTLAHTARINSVAASPDGKFSATASDDGTVRLWHVATGELVRVFRAHRREGSFPPFETVAISPDASLVAAVTRSGEGAGMHSSLYLWSSLDGTLLSRFEDPSKNYAGVTFSPDGHLIALSWNDRWDRVRLADPGDSRKPAMLEVVELQGLTRIAKWSEGNGDLAGIEWAEAGRMFVAGDSLYSFAWNGTGLKVDHELVIGGGDPSEFARLTPDGSLLAVVGESKRVWGIKFANIYRSATFEPVSGEPGAITDVADWISNSAVAIMSEDAKSEVSTFGPAMESETPLRAIPVPWPSVSTFRRCGDGLLIAGEHGSWTFWDGEELVSGRESETLGMNVPEWRESMEEIILNAGSFRATYLDSSGHERVFDLGERRFGRLESRNPRETSISQIPKSLVLRGATRTDESTDSAPEVDWHLGTMMLDDLRETGRGAVVTEDSRLLLAYTDRELILYRRGRGAAGPDSWGEPVWKSFPAVPVIGVGLQSDGGTPTFVVSLHEDGTVRWSRFSDGSEVFAAYADPGGGSWVVWTPEGYYDGSPGAEKFLGWHFESTASTAPKFVPVSRFRSVFYRPDVISKMLSALDIDEAVELANAEIGRPGRKREDLGELLAAIAPPVIEAPSDQVLKQIDLASTSQSIEIPYRVESTGKTAATRLEVRFNGRPLVESVPLESGGGSGTLEVSLPKIGEGLLSIFATDGTLSSEPAVVRITQSVPSGTKPKPAMHIVSVGVAALESNRDEEGRARTDLLEGRSGGLVDGRLHFIDLPGADTDATRVAACFSKHGKRFLDSVETETLIDGDATKERILKAVRDAALKSDYGDIVLVSFACHGHSDPSTEFILIPHDHDPSDPLRSGLSGRELREALAGARGNVLLLLDTCHSESVLGRSRDGVVLTGIEDLGGFVNALGDPEHGIVVLAAATEDGVAFGSDEEGGVFTRALEEGMDGGALSEGRVTPGSLLDHLRRRVPEMLAEFTEEGGNLHQEPVLIMPETTPEMTLALPAP